MKRPNSYESGRFLINQVLKTSNNYMCRISNIDYILPPKKNICNIFLMCVGEVLLNKWKQGNTLFSKI